MMKEKKAGGALRITLLTSCQSGCDFCHLEGHKTQSELRTLNPAISSWRTTGRLVNLVTKDDIESAIQIAKKMDLDAINLTGGEPTLHPDLKEIISRLNQEGFSVAMTTHAEIPQKKFMEYLEAGLEWVIVSFHSLNPEQYLAMDLVAQELEQKYNREVALRYAEKRLKMKLGNIEYAIEKSNKGELEGIVTNTVLLNLDQAKGIINYCNEKGILPRVQRDLNEPEKSQVLFDELISDLDAECFKEYEAVGDSSGAGFDYSYFDKNSGKKYLFRFKDFGHVYVDKMCDGCNKKDTKYCREKFYGVRLERGIIRTCIDLNRKGVTLFSHEDFIEQLDVSDSVPGQIAKQYKSVLSNFEAS